jgi:hypothetical protein
MALLSMISLFMILTFMTPLSMASAAPLTIENSTLAVKYDEASDTFSVTEKATGAVFLKDGKLDGKPDGTAAKAKVQDGDAGPFGACKQIVVPRADGVSWTLELNNTPFLFLRGRVDNSGDKTKDIAKMVPATFSIDLGKPAAGLRTLGTGGLTAPEKNPGSYLFLTVADPETRRGVVAGWLTNDRGSGVVFSEVKGEGTNAQVALRAQIDYGHLRIPASDGGAKAQITAARLETLVLGVFDDARLGEELYADAVAKHYRIKLRPQPAGYCTWYSDKHSGAGDEKSIVELGEFVVKELKPFGFSFLQMDDQWQDGGDYNGPRRGFDRVKPDGPFSHGIKPVAEQLEKLGLTTGIWFMPFARNHQDPEYKDRQHWFVKREDGKPYETPWGGTSLDISNPEVRSHLVALVKTIHSWGVNYFKMDGLWTGSATEQIYVNDGYRDDHIGNNAPFNDPLKTNVENYRDGLKLVRETAGPDVFLSGCNVSQNMRTLGGTIGLVDSMRIGPDNGQGWCDYRTEIAKTECSTIITGPIRGSRLYFLNGRVWWNDPDPTYVRQSIPLKHAQLITSWVALSGAFYLNSDWIPDLPAERLNIIKRTIPAHDATARPVDYFESIMPSIWLVTDARQAVRRDVLGLFNWDNDPRPMTYSAAKAGLDATKTYHAFDFWAKEPLPPFQGKFQFDVPGQTCRVIALRAMEGHPVLASTSRHVTQGIVDVRDEKWNPASNELSGVSKVVGNDPYELRIAGLNDGGKWMVESVAVSPEDTKAGVAIEPFASSAADTANWTNWQRVTINSKQNREVHWTIKFKKP